MKESLRIIFAGTPLFAEKHLRALIRDHSIVAVYTQPDRPAGRNKKIKASEVKQFALQHHIPVFQPSRFRSEDIENLRALQPDLMIVIAYGLILPEAVLQIPTYGCINVHASLLPSWRGAAPIQYAIMAGEKNTGISIIQMTSQLDAGHILYQQKTPIHPSDTSETLANTLSTLGCQILPMVIDKIAHQTITAIPQNEKKVTFAPKLKKSESTIQWDQSAHQISCFIRALHPWPVAWTQYGDMIVRIWLAHPCDDPGEQNTLPGTIIKTDKSSLIVQCKKSTLAITQLQMPGKKMMDVKSLDLKSSNALFKIGSRFG